MVKISVITISYNNAEGLKRTVESVISQDYKDLEYIVIDGGSEDGSAQILETYGNRIAYHTSEKDNGIYHAMNKGIAKATGEYLLFLNSGDELKNACVISEAARQTGDHDLVYTNLELRQDNETTVKHYPASLSFKYFLFDSLPHPATLIRKKLFDQYGLYDESLKICSDWAFFINMVCHRQVSYKKINMVLSVFYLDGISSSDSYRKLIAGERDLVLKRDFALFADLQQDIIKGDELKQHVSSSRLIRLAKRFGFLRHL